VTEASKLRRSVSRLPGQPREATDRIVGGTPTTTTAFPFIVSIQT
jgi:hypothetical protein